MKYPNLNSLIQSDNQAKQFFYSLPEYVQEQIMQRADSVNSMESLQDYADNITRGDN